jgi:hypothetical protein
MTDKKLEIMGPFKMVVESLAKAGVKFKSLMIFVSNQPINPFKLQLITLR